MLVVNCLIPKKCFFAYYYRETINNVVLAVLFFKTDCTSIGVPMMKKKLTYILF